ncbi:uncharacterized protein LOC114183310 [Vigna unguiculata]|uniref:RTA-like protein n=1 Tax=Vigna unguiculata TaxID=3917 RepID=A0A4D6NI42_VIGUN|nr:uncharacterized protein LOC114183310 [Vigna unguiculata]QCE11805.1 RTA-like protein [Vigna unguiculata]
MGIIKPPVFMLLIIMVLSTTIVEGRTLSLISAPGYSKIFATLGVVCKCCDGVGGACTSTWTQSCNNLQCYPWKSH